MTFIKKGAIAITSTMIMAAMFLGCSEAYSTSSLNKGSGIKVETSVYDKINQTILGKESEINKLIKTEYELSILDKDKDGDLQVKVTIKNAYVKEEEDKKVKTEYHSISGLNITDPLASTTATVYSAAVGESFKVSLDKTGSVKMVEGSNELLQKIMDKLKISDTKIKNQIEAAAKEQFDEEALKGKVGDIIIKQIADKNVSSGDSWITEEPNPDDKSSTIKFTYKVSNTDGDICNVSISGKSDKDIKFEDSLDNGSKLTYTGACEGTGDLVVDRKSGITSKANMLLKFKGNMEFKSGPKELKGKKGTITMERQVYVKIKK